MSLLNNESKLSYTRDMTALSKRRIMFVTKIGVDVD